MVSIIRDHTLMMEADKVSKTLTSAFSWCSLSLEEFVIL
jgi:hypothetical protein